MSVLTAPTDWVEPSSTVRRLLTPSRTSLLVLMLAVSLAIRIQGLSVNGFTQDEVAKLHAIEAYRRGDFSANAEHPMLMKLAMWGSLAGAERWNAYVPESMAIAPETALRLPNAVAGALTPLAVFGAAASLLDPTAGLIAALFVALDPTIISVNRIGKEDTFLMLFFMLATACYERAKNCATARERKTRYEESHRLYKSGTNGDREYLNAAEIDEARAKAAADVATWCG